MEHFHPALSATGLCLFSLLENIYSVQVHLHMYLCVHLHVCVRLCGCHGVYVELR